MKRFWGSSATAIGIAVALTFSSIPALAASPAIGGTCKKVSQKVVVKAKTLVCSKVGKKLAWKAVVAKPIIPTGPKIPTSFSLPLDFDNLSIDTPEISLILTKQAFEVSNSANVLNTVIKGPNVSDSSVQASTMHLQRAINFLSKHWKPSKITSIFFNEKDGSWIDQAIDSAGGNSKSVTPQGQPFSVALGSRNFNCNTGTAQTTSNGPLWIQCLGTKATKDGLSTIAAHEYFHLFQQAFKRAEGKIQWADEGTANYFGSVVGLYLQSKTPNDIWQFRTNQKSYFDSQLKDFIETNDLAGIAARFKQLEQGGNGQIDNSGYMLGQYASEVLIAVGGWDKFLQLNMRLGDSTSFAESFRTLYGLTLDQFYPKVAAYVVKQR
jgi:hypothetical protein